MRNAFLLPFLVAAVAACSARYRGPVPAWHPYRSTEVPDSTRVRFRLPGNQVVAQGIAIGWRLGAPRIVIASGDTVAPPPFASFQVFTGRHATHAVTGALVGLLAGIGVVLGTCDSNYCGEQDPTPALGALLGAVIGTQVKRDAWVTVSPDTGRTDPPRP